MGGVTKKITPNHKILIIKHPLEKPTIPFFSTLSNLFPAIFSTHQIILGFMTPTEKELFAAVPANEFNTYWVPCTWFVYRIQEATKRGKLLNQYSLENIMRVG